MFWRKVALLMHVSWVKALKRVCKEQTSIFIRQSDVTGEKQAQRK